MPAENTIEVFIRVIGDPEPPELIGHLWEADCDVCGFSPLLGPDGGPINMIARHLHKQVGYLEEE